MIISDNSKPSLSEFAMLMKKTDALLNREAAGKQDYYSKRNSSLLEEDVYDALCRSAVGTPFDRSIILVSGASFPDIVAKKYYGVEVKSTIKNQWKSIGSSILESTRDQNVERIYLTFGKLGKPVAFRSRPYEQCLSGISVTHYPRYQIDMELSKGETIFDKMGIAYDDLRKMDNPVAPVSKYYKSKLKEGETLWWATGEGEDSFEKASPPILRLWTSLSVEQKNYYTVQGYALFPEVLIPNSTTKYQRYALWLAKNCSVLNTNIRDQFSAGGRKEIRYNGKTIRVPAALYRVLKNRDRIEETIWETSASALAEYWQVNTISDNRMNQWCSIVSMYVSKDEDIGISQYGVYSILCDAFQC